MAESNVFTFDSAYLVRQRMRIMREIRYADYQVGNTWHRANIESSRILSDGRVEVVFIIDHTIAGNITVTGVRLYDENGEKIGEKSTSITREDATEGIAYTVRIKLFQAVENSGNTGAYDEI